MRLDKFLSTVNLTKRRTVAQDMIRHQAVYVNGSVAKASRAVKTGDVIEFRYLDETRRFTVLDLPATKTIPKSDKEKYVREMP